MRDIKLKGVQLKDRKDAIFLIWKFESEYADRVGIRNGVGYLYQGLKAYVYQTKTAIVLVADYGETE